MALAFIQSRLLVCTAVVHIAHVKGCECGCAQYSYICKQQKVLCTEQWEADLCKTNKRSELDYCSTK